MLWPNSLALPLADVLSLASLFGLYACHEICDRAGAAGAGEGPHAMAAKPSSGIQDSLTICLNVLFGCIQVTHASFEPFVQ